MSLVHRCHRLQHCCVSGCVWSDHECWRNFQCTQDKCTSPNHRPPLLAESEKFSNVSNNSVTYSNVTNNSVTYNNVTNNSVRPTYNNVTNNNVIYNIVSYLVTTHNYSSQ